MRIPTEEEMAAHAAAIDTALAFLRRDHHFAVFQGWLEELKAQYEYELRQPTYTESVGALNRCIGQMEALQDIFDKIGEMNLDSVTQHTPDTAKVARSGQPE